MITPDSIEKEEKEREEKFLEEIGPLGRMLDNHMTYIFLVLFWCLTSFSFVFILSLWYFLK